MLGKVKSVVNYGAWALRYGVVNLCAIGAVQLFGAGRAYKGAWLIAELPHEARDNGYWFYKFVAESHPEVNVYYAIKHGSPDYEKLPHKERVIEYGSFAHYVAHVRCARSISSHIYGASPGRYFCRPFLPLMDKKEEIFLQHGILANVINLRGYNGVTIYTTDSERELFIKSGHHEPQNLKQVGLARFDNLIDASEGTNVLLVMPTFRSYLRNLSHMVSDEEFVASTFYQKWNALLNNPALLEMITSNGMKVIFYPHRQMQPFNHLWNFHDDITIGSPQEYDIQTLLRGAKLMITDYSSTYYDLMYMKKPAIVYQFDKDEVLGAHYKGSGEYPLAVNTTQEDEVVQVVAGIIKNNYQLSLRAVKDVAAFYPYRDTNNRQRIFEVVKGVEL